MSIIQLTGAGSDWPATPASDPYASNLVLALPLNSSYGIRDQSAKIRGSGSSYGLTTIAGTLDSSASKFYGSSFLAGPPNGATQRLFVPSTTPFGTADFCIEGWAFIPTMGTQNLSLYRAHNDTRIGILLLYNGSQTNTPGALYFANGEPSGEDVAITPNYSFPTGQWNHFAVTRSGNALRIFINGVSRVSYQPSGGIYGNFTYTGQVNIFNGSNTAYNTARLQDFRVYQGIAKYTSNFTPPGAMFV